MPNKSMTTTLPAWLSILIVGSIVGVSMGRAQSMGLYLAPITQALGIGRESFGLAMALTQLLMGIGAPLSGGLIDRFGAGPADHGLRPVNHRRPVVHVCGDHLGASTRQRRPDGVRRQRHRRHLAGGHGQAGWLPAQAPERHRLGRHGGRYWRLRGPTGHAPFDRNGGLATEPALADDNHGAADPARLADQRPTGQRRCRQAAEL